MKDISLVIQLPYNSQSSDSLWSSFQHILNNNNPFNNIRVRIWHKKAVSSLAVYESAYTYCPNRSVIVSSRFNIRFDSQFSKQVANSINEKNHYYSVEFTNEEGKAIDFSRLGIYNDKIRMEALYFRSHFRYVQIFKSDLLKMHYMHILKCAEIDFYET